MHISSQSNISFGYSHPLKTLWQRGKLPSVTHGLYGDKLTKKNCTLEHLKCYSYSKDNNLRNLTLATKYKNNLRSNEDIRKYLTPKMAYKYLLQFKDVVVEHKNYILDGNMYIRMIINTLEQLGLDLSKFHKKLL